MLKLSPLDAVHRALGAKMASFAGWEMPISYAGTIAEHEAVRARAGIFDVSHLGKFLVRGPGAAAFLDGQLSNRMADLQPGRARYTLILNDDAGIIDDLIVYGLAPDEYLVVPNASNRDAVHAVVAAAAPPGIAVDIVEWTTIAVQGPRAIEIVASRFPFAKDLTYMRVARDRGVVVSRSGYTGEVGFEIFTEPNDGERIWNELLAGVREVGGEPCGLAARDTLRLEMGYPLHGNDISILTTPADANLMWAVALEDREFPGARALRECASTRSLVGLRMTDKVIPRAHCPVLRGDDVVGECTSGTFSPTLRVGIAMAYVARDALGGGELTIDVRGKRGRAQLVDPPFVDRSPK